MLLLSKKCIVLALLGFFVVAVPHTVHAAPIVRTLPATHVDGSSATLVGTANPNGTPTTVWFQYSIENNFTNTTPPKTGFAIIGSTTHDCDEAGGECLYTYRINLLSSNKTFYYRIGAEQETSNPVYGDIVSFDTLPTNPLPPEGTPAPSDIVTLPATDITETSAVLHGRANPQGYSTIGWFNYARDTAYSVGSNSVLFDVIGDGTTDTNFSYTLTGLSPGTTYYYRAGAMHSDADPLYSFFGEHFKTLGGDDDQSTVSNNGTSQPGQPPVIPEPVIVDTGALVQCYENCGYIQAITLIQRIVKFLLFTLSLPIAAGLFMYTGFLFVTGGGSSANHSKAKKIFLNVFIGLAIALSAWLIVNTILTSLLSQEAIKNGALLLHDTNQ